jgi:hypothetical protein
MKITSIRGAGALAVAALLAGCAGAATAPPTAGNASIVSQQGMAGDISFDAASCKSGKAIKVKPCSVKISTTEPTANVKVKYPKADDITDNDTSCSKNDIATVAGTDGEYVVTAGTKKGKCTVKFTVTSGKKAVGTVALSVTNNL